MATLIVSKYVFFAMSLVMITFQILMCQEKVMVTFQNLVFWSLSKEQTCITYHMSNFLDLLL
jgi:hypothetical protein